MLILGNLWDFMGIICLLNAVSIPVAYRKRFELKDMTAEVDGIVK